jgi:hypothetical protein
MSKLSRSTSALPSFVLFEASAFGVPSAAFTPPSPDLLQLQGISISSPDSMSKSTSSRKSWPGKRTPNSNEKSPLQTSRFLSSLPNSTPVTPIKKSK